MSEVKHASVCYPPSFPMQIRLPTRPQQIHQNLRRQRQQERDYHDALCMAAGRRLIAPCTKTLHISLFFDGTGNNLNYDLYESVSPHPTNIARLFRATIGDGHAGGTHHGNSRARRLTDAAGIGHGQYFKYYMPGVGTPFAEVGDLDYTDLGLAFARFGEERISWGLLMLIDALRRTLGLPRQDDASLLASVKAMGSLSGLESVNASVNRYHEFNKQLAVLAKPLRTALSQPQPGLSKLLGIRLYVYGFSRGATAARAFVSALNQLLSREDSTPSLRLMDLTLPVSVEYLGLLDTVASVGFADIVPGANGHMSWADGNQQLPVGELVKRCLHLVASHEQRLCFPLESIRRPGGGYPVNCQEVIYPGVHSDVGGGYPPGDQGKALSSDVRVGDGLLLSQIALNDLYADAFAHGAPLKVPRDALPTTMRNELWRAMEDDVVRAFSVSPHLVNRFNAWRQITLGLPAVTQPLSPEQTEHYQPIPATDTLEQAKRDQLAWITAWRIDRYAFASLLETPFYRQATDTHADEAVQKEAEAERNKKQTAIELRRKQQQAHERIPGTLKKPLEPGLPDFDADLAQTQLLEAAEEFGKDFRSIGVLASPAMSVARLVIFPILLPSVITAVARAEHQQIKAAGQAKVSQLFPPPLYEKNHLRENFRGNVDESRNAMHAEGLLRALFDDQVHDSRAWFLYSLGRELGGSYFSERMVFFGDSGRRDLALYGENDAATLAKATARPATDATLVEQRPLSDPQRLAEVHKAIDAIWEDFYANVDEVKNAQG